MVAITPRIAKKRVHSYKMARSSGASYGTEIMISPDSKEFEKTIGEGITSFGGAAGTADMMGMTSAGEGLYPFGSGLMVMGGGLTPFGIGFVSKLKGFARKAKSVIRGAVPAQLRRAAVDYGKKKSRELLPAVMSKVKEEINKQAPGLAVRLTAPLLKKVPEQYREAAGEYVKKGTQKGLSLLGEQIDQLSGKMSGGAIAPYRQRGVSDMIPLPVPTSDSYEYSGKQLDFMRSQGEELARQRQAGNVPKRLVLDHHSRSLLDQIMSEKGYERSKQQDAREQFGLLSLPSNPDRVGTARATSVLKARSVPARKVGRPKGTKVGGKGIVKL